MFREMIKRALDYKQNPSDFMDEVMQELEVPSPFLPTSSVRQSSCSLTGDLFVMQNFDLEKREDLSEGEEDGLKAESPEKL